MTVVPATDKSRLPMLALYNWQHVLFLPLYPEMPDEAVDEMASVIHSGGCKMNRPPDGQNNTMRAEPPKSHATSGTITSAAPSTSTFWPRDINMRLLTYFVATALLGCGRADLDRSPPAQWTVQETEMPQLQDAPIGTKSTTPLVEQALTPMEIETTIKQKVQAKDRLDLMSHNGNWIGFDNDATLTLFPNSTCELVLYGYAEVRYTGTYELENAVIKASFPDGSRNWQLIASVIDGEVVLHPHPDWQPSVNRDLWPLREIDPLLPSEPEPIGL